MLSTPDYNCAYFEIYLRLSFASASLLLFHDCVINIDPLARREEPAEEHLPGPGTAFKLTVRTRRVDPEATPARNVWRPFVGFYILYALLLLNAGRCMHGGRPVVSRPRHRLRRRHSMPGRVARA